MIEITNEIKKVIFDIDYTLLVPNYSKEKEEFLLKEIPDAGDEILERISLVLMDYEKNHSRYDREELTNHLNKYSKQYIPDDFVDKWILYSSNIEEQNLDETIEILNYLKEKNIEIVALTNWFTEAQTKKLENANILHYFDQVYGGDLYLKPNVESFINAAGDVPLENCLMVGDNYPIDIDAAKKIGMNAVLIDKNDKYKDINSIKTLKKIKEII